MQVIRTDSFVGGLNLRADPFQLGPDESPDLLNVDVDPRGGFSMRSGFERINTTAVGSIANGSFTPEQLYAWHRSSPQIILSANSKVFYSTGGNFTDTTIAVSSADGGCFAPWSGSSTDVLYVASGVGTSTMSKWSGSAKSSLTASATAAWQDSLASPTGTHMPRCDFVAAHVDRLWVASTRENGTDYPNRVRFSHPNFPESWREVDYIDIVEGGSGITALVPFGGALIVFKKNSIHAIYGYDTDTFQVVTLTSSLGAPSSHSVVATEGGLFFFDWPDGVFLYDGSGFTDLFEKLRPLQQTINDSYLGNIRLSHGENRLWLSVPINSATTPTHTYVFDPTIEAWTLYQLSDGAGLSAVIDYVASTGTRSLVASHPTDAYALKLNETISQDDIRGTDTNFPSYYVTRWQDADVVSAKKMWRRPDFVVQVPSSDTRLTVQSFRDWDEATVQRLFYLDLDAATSGLQWEAEAAEPDANLGWGEAPWGSDPTGARFVRGNNLGSARAVRLKISGPGGKPWGVNSITYKYNARRIR
jgi:hypothetical protein